MDESPNQDREDAETERPPLGSWRTTYVVVCVAALVTMVLLRWLTVAFDRGVVR